MFPLEEDNAYLQVYKYKNRSSKMIILRMSRVLSFQCVLTVKSAGRYCNIREMSSLLLNKSLVNGAWVSAASNKELAVLNPVNGVIVGNVPDMNAADTQSAIEAASKAFRSPQWSGLTAKERSGLLKVYTIYSILILYFIDLSQFSEMV